MLGQPINPAMKDFHVFLFLRLEVDYMKEEKGAKYLLQKLITHLAKVGKDKEFEGEML